MKSIPLGETPVPLLCLQQNGHQIFIGYLFTRNLCQKRCDVHHAQILVPFRIVFYLYSE